MLCKLPPTTSARSEGDELWPSIVLWVAKGAPLCQEAGSDTAGSPARGHIHKAV